jgi:hypothetical protein
MSWWCRDTVTPFKEHLLSRSAKIEHQLAEISKRDQVAADGFGAVKEAIEKIEMSNQRLIREQFLTLHEVMERISESHANLVRCNANFHQEQGKHVLNIVDPQHQQTRNITDSEENHNLLYDCLKPVQPECSNALLATIVS